MTGGLLGYLGGGAIEGIIVFQVAVLLIVLGNSWVWYRLGSRSRLGSRVGTAPGLRLGPDDASGGAPLVSVLVPCRNEEANARACVRSLMAQTYGRLEVIALDDQSEDGTLRILEEERAADARLRMLQGEPLPEGWAGKNWACHQLAQAAQGDVLVFVDADTVLAPEAVERLVAMLEAEDADFLSGLPQQVLGTVGERFLVPIFCWALFSFTPLVLGYLWRRAAVPTAVGQLMVFRREAYSASGGHAGIKGSIVDDLSLARSVRRAGLRALMIDAGELASCRMYRSGREAYRGFRKNLFGAFGYAVLPYAFVWPWLAWVYLEPLVVLAACLLAPERTAAPTGLLTATIALSLAQWVYVYARLRLPVWPAILYPLTLLGFEAMAVSSFVSGVRRKTAWRGRNVDRPRIRLL